MLLRPRMLPMMVMPIMYAEHAEYGDDTDGIRLVTSPDTGRIY